MTNLTTRKDLTRWNRGGLQRFRYVDGNAVSHLETLRQAMAAAFTNASGENQWQALDTAMPVPQGESAAEAQARWLAQYRDERRDYGWEILRAFARAGHVLTEHLDAYANETYLDTATQWDNVRRLCRMLDYHTAPAASAQTPLALLAKPDRSGTVEAGFAVKNKPQDASAPAVFETLDDLEIDPRLNQIRPLAWNHSQTPLAYLPLGKGGVLKAPEPPGPGEEAEPHFATFPFEGELEDVSVGTLGVLIVETAAAGQVGVAVRVSSMTDTALVLEGGPPPDGFPALALRHQVRLLLKPAFRETPKLSGSNVIVLAAQDSAGLRAGNLIAWQSAGLWNASRVVSVERNRIELADGVPAVGAGIYALTLSKPQYLGAETDPKNRAVLPTDRKADDVWTGTGGKVSTSSILAQEIKDGTGVLYEYVDGDVYGAGVYYLATADTALSTVAEATGAELEFDGDAGELVSGGWVIAVVGSLLGVPDKSALGQPGSSTLSAQRIAQIEEGDGSYVLRLDGTSLLSPKAVYADFEVDIRPTDFDVNATPAFATSLALRSDEHSTIYLQLDEFPELLDVGRVLIVAGLDAALEVTVKEVDPAAGWIKVAPALPGSELSGSGTTQTYTRHATVIYGNVVTAGHGESGKRQVLGSGAATRSGQQFELALKDVAFVADPSMPAGVAAALEVTVDARTWQQVATLHDSEPEDPHYTVRVTEHGTLLLQFGDGWHGRRLPTGQNNVRATARVGTGLAGNLPAWSLDKIVKPHMLVEAVVQPVLASGGNDMEGVESMREFAPASVLSLARAVSLDDFTHLASANSSVWQARAFRRQPGPGRTENIEIAVVPAGGGELGGLEDSLQAFIAANALPGIAIAIRRFEPVILDLNVDLQIREDEFDADLVAAEVRGALQTAFSLEAVRLGEPLFLSRIFEVVEQVTGVANSQCAIDTGGFRDDRGAPVTVRSIASGASGAIKRVSVYEQQAIYLNASLSSVNITTRAFSL
jgi:hypothetical protein